MVEAVTADGQILATSEVAGVRGHIEDDWHIHGLIALGLIKRAVSSLLVHDQGPAGLPLHGELVILSNRNRANLADHSVFGVRAEAIGRIDLELEVEESPANLRVDEWEFI